MAITVDPKIVKRILAEIGVPIIDIQDVNLTDEDVKDLFIEPAMKRYFTYIPKEVDGSYQINGRVEIDFPNDEVYGVAHARVALSYRGGVVFNPIHNRTHTRARRSSYTRDPYNTMDASLMEEAEAMTYITLRKAGNFSVDRKNKKLVGYSNVSGELVVKWASFSEDFEDIKFEHEDDVVSLAKAYALRFMGMLRTQQDPNAGTSLDHSSFLQRADDLETKIIEKWQNRTKVILLR